MAVRLLTEDRDLYKGIFWITDLDNVYANQLYFQIPVTSDGIVINPEVMHLNSKNGDNYNHKLVWKELTPKETQNKPFDYFPRGRIEINRGKATIYANPNICTQEVLDWLTDKFNLTKNNGITKVVMNPDGSEHYKCYLDR